MVFITVPAVIALFAASATSVLGSPWPSTLKHSTHRVRDLEHGVQVRAFQPESVYEVCVGFLDMICYSTSVTSILIDPLTFTIVDVW